MTSFAQPPRILWEDLVRRSLAEDLGRGDATTDAIVGIDEHGGARLVARTGGRIAGTGPALAAFRLLDPEIAIEVHVDDGEAIDAGAAVATLEGSARGLLSAERVALNLLGHLSGVASLTRRFVDAVAHTRARIVDTRKTTPGLRLLEKHAVRCGGGRNHRLGLDDAVLIKDNHIALAGGLGEAVARARRHRGHLVAVEVEVDTLQQLDEALALEVDAVLLDNMDPDLLRRAVDRTAGRALLEASGAVSLETVAAIAETGVDLISVGALTHSAPSLDLGLDWRS